MKAPEIDLNNGVKIPQLGLGTWKVRGTAAEQSVRWALEIGYRHIDTARIYLNEKRVGKAIAASGIPRKDIFVTTKIFNNQHKDPVRALDNSLRRLGLDYVDLYLIHWPVPERHRTWEILEGEYKKGKTRAIGVSNFTIRHLDELIKGSSIIPAVNQVEFSPFLYQENLLKYCKSQGIALEAYSPLTHGERMDNEKISKIALKYGKTNAQVMIRWSLQHGNIVLPKSSKEERITENFEVFDFKLSPQHMKILDNMNENFRVAWDPENML